MVCCGVVELVIRFLRSGSGQGRQAMVGEDNDFQWFIFLMLMKDVILAFQALS